LPAAPFFAKIQVRLKTAIEQYTLNVRDGKSMEEE